jgi:uncharacterized protein (DUF4213/DUF364 family)
LECSELRKAITDPLGRRDYPVKYLLSGLHLTAVETRVVGLSATITNDESGVDSSGITLFKDSSANEILDLLHSGNWLEASIGLACLNSLLDMPAKYQRGNAWPYIERLATGKRLGMIGHFPFASHLRRICTECYIFEYNPQDGDLPASAIPDLLPQCEIVIITGQCIANGSIGEVLQYSGKAFKVLLGPSAPLTPALFDFGVDMIGGSRVADPDLVKRSIEQGACYRRLPGIELITIFREDC